MHFVSGQRFYENMVCTLFPITSFSGEGEVTRSQVKSGVSFKHIVGQEYRYIMNQSVMLRESPRVDMIIIGALNTRSEQPSYCFHELLLDMTGNK